MGIAVEVAFSLAPLRYFDLSCPHFYFRDILQNRYPHLAQKMGVTDFGTGILPVRLVIL